MITLRKNDEKDPQKRYANEVWNLTQIESEIKNISDRIDALGISLLAAIASISAVVVPVKATGAEIDAKTDDAKFVTPKAIQDSKLGEGGGPLFDHLHLTGIIVQEAWIAPTLINSWVNFGSGYNPAGYFKDKNGIVHLRGLIKSGTVTAVAFVLPAGYRPEYTEESVVYSNAAVAECTIGTNGDVTVVSGSNVYFYLDGITFRAYA